MGDSDLYMVQIINEVPTTPSVEPIGFTFRDGIAVYLWRDLTWSHLSVNAKMLSDRVLQLLSDHEISDEYITEMMHMINGYKFYIPMVMSNKIDGDIPYMYYRLLYPIADPFNK
jgi:hypothetical protein